MDCILALRLINTVPLIFDIIPKTGQDFTWSLEMNITGRISIDPGDVHKDIIGNIIDLDALAKQNGIRQIIFDSGKMNFAWIIECMNQVSHPYSYFLIATPDGRSLVGSGSVICPVTGSQTAKIT